MGGDSSGMTTSGMITRAGKFAATKSNADKLKQLIYEPTNFTNMIDMFQQGGVDSFYDNMGITVNGLLDEMETRYGEQSDAQLAAMSLIAVGLISDDLISGDILPELTSEDVSIAIANSIKTWSELHSDRAGMEDALNEVAMAAQQEQAAGGGIMDENVVVGTGAMP